MLTITDLNMSFGDLKVLDNLNLNINEGEVVAIIGSSGSGKSTLLRSINYLEKPQSGFITLDDMKLDFSNINPSQVKKLRSKSAMVFQSFALFKNKTAIENIMEVFISVKKIDKKEARQKAYELLKQVGLSDKADVYPSKLSGGQKQRVGIARALACNPKILLFDEPTSALDPELVKEVLNVIIELTKDKKTMLIVTHEMQFAKRVADKIVYLDNGKVAAFGTPDQIFGNSMNKRLTNFIQEI